MFALVAFVTKLLSPKPDQQPTVYQQEQDSLLQQLRDASDLRTRQLILDKMMAENLLRSADLSNAALHDIHLESANLEEADLCHSALAEADLEGANLQHADLSDADLTSADLLNANLSEAELTHIQLDGATLAKADLSGADLRYACLRGASLYDADLKGAQLDHADLRNCCLMYANLQGASLHGALLDETTVLPDGELWTPQANLQPFTDHSHPDWIPHSEPGSAVLRSTSLAE